MRTHRLVFLFAPFYHEAMKHVAPVRQSLKMRTVFNLLGPLVNPAQPKRQVIGVHDEKDARKWRKRCGESEPNMPYSLQAATA